MTDKRIHKFFDRATIEEQASDWLIRLDREETNTTEELAELREWINRSPAHRESLDDLSEVWSNLDVLSRLAVPLGRRDAHLAGFLRESRRWMCPRNVAMAATVLMGVLTLVLISNVFDADRDGSGINSGFFATEIGEIRTLNLSDGSVIQLNTGSQVEIDFTTSLRTVFLNHGEAHFTIASDSNRPFAVYSNFGSVKAVGTAFQVRVHANDLEVTVTEGVVELGAVEIPAVSGTKDVSTVGMDTAGIAAQVPRTFSAPLRQLAAGQKARFNGAEKAIGLVTDLAHSEVAIQLSWREGQLTFAGESLDDVISEISRYTNTEVVIIDSEISNIKIGGRFKVGEVDALLEVLQASFDVEVRRVSPSRVELSVASSG